MDDSGNFSLAVLQTALKRSHDLDLLSWTSTEGRAQQDPCLQMAFIINHESHWYTLRKIGCTWWNLDSVLDRPEHISDFYLDAYLGQLRADGCGVFLVSGNLSPAGVFARNEADNPLCVWYTQSQLLEEKQASSQRAARESAAATAASSSSSFVPAAISGLIYFGQQIFSGSGAIDQPQARAHDQGQGLIRNDHRYGVEQDQGDEDAEFEAAMAQAIANSLK